MAIKIMNQVPHFFIFCILLLLCLPLGNAQTPVTWLSHTGIAAGKYQLVVGRALVSGYTSYYDGLYYNYYYNINYGKTLGVAPDIVVGLISVDMIGNTSLIEFYNDYTNSYSTYYEHVLFVNILPNIFESTISFLAVDYSSVPFLSIGFANYATSLLSDIYTSGFRTEAKTMFFGGGSINIANQNALMIFLNGYSISKYTTTGSFNLQLQASVINSTNYLLKTTTTGSTMVYNVQYHRMFFDITVVESTMTQFFDIGTMEGTSNTQTIWPTILSQQASNFIAGISNFSITPNPRATYAVQIVSPFNITNTGGYTSLKFIYWNFRVRKCVSPNIYYRITDQMCYSTCPPYTYVNTTYNFCYGCNYACYSCTGPAINLCTSCDPATTYRDLVSGACVCKTGTYDAGSATCLMCHYTCSTCTGGTSTTCLTCPSGRSLVGSTCPCPAGFYDNGVVTCVACNSPCLNCTSPTICTSCPATRALSASTCVCLAGYYDNGTATCLVCSYTCMTCISTSTICLTCPTTRTLSGSTCPCNTGFYDNGVSTCVACPSSCYTCSNVSCLVCFDANMSPSGMSCLCNAGYYLSGVTTCSACNMNCLTCSGSSTNCLTCRPTMVLSGTVCVCSPGTFNNGTGCQTCSIPNCQQCTSPTVCTVCLSGSPINGVCGCPVGQYLNGSTCTSCASLYPGCTECDSTTCTACDPTRTLVSNTCPCSLGYYENGTLSCPACQVTCMNCTSTACLLCVGADMYPSGTSCVCDPGFYNSAPTVCSACAVNCSTCIGTSTYCTSCDATLSLVLSGNICVCMSGYFNNGTGCQACNQTLTNCLQCTSSNICQSCSAGSPINGLCGCPVGQYLNVNVCLACTYLYPGCTACNITECTSCDSALGWQLTSPTVCSCMVGYIFVAANTTCTSCGLLMSGCVECSTTSTCTVCQAPQWTLASGSCMCSVGYYLSGSSCVACDATCLTCNGGSSANCTSCNTTIFVQSGSSCVCPIGQFYVAPTSCQNCDISCETCSGNLSTNCLTCPSILTLTGTQCLCPISSQYYNGSCQPCDASCSTCSGPLSSNCLTCTASAVLAAGTCQCPAGMFMNSTYFCETCDVICATCVSQTTQCLSCNSPLVLVGSVCSCSSGQYLTLSGTVYSCPSCDNSCANCTGPLATDCLSCLPLMILQSGSCYCSQGYFFDTTAIACTACDATCANCTGPTASECTACNNATQFRVLNGTICSCNNFTTDVGVPICQWVGCPPGSNQVANDCIPICGDGVILMLEQCDDGNTISGDGCSSDCVPEANFTCAVPSGQTASICSYNQPMTLNLTNTQKQLTSNTVVFTFDIGPVIPALSSVDFSQLFSTNLTGVNLSFEYDGNGQLVVYATYNDSIQGEDVLITFNPLASNNPYFFYTPPSQMQFVVDPTNNQAAYYYDEFTYSQVKIFEYLGIATMALALAGFAGGLVASKFIGVELVGVVQIAYIGLMAINHLQPMLAALTKIGFINGINTMFEGSKALSASEPNRIQALNYTPEMIFSMNYMTALLLLPPLAALFTFIASKVAKSKEERLRLISWNILCEYGFTFVLFCLYHMVVSLVVYAMYAGDFGQQKMLPFNLAQCVVTFGLAIALSVLYKFKPEHFGDYKKGFKAEDPFSQLYYYMIIGGRVAVCVILVAANGIDYVGFISLVVPIASIVVLAVKKPYAHPYNTYRAIGNEAVVALVLGTYGYYRAMVPYTQNVNGINNVLPYVVIVLLLACVLANIAIMGKYKYDMCKSAQKTEEAKAEETAKEIKQEKDLQKDLFEDMKTRVRNMTVLRKMSPSRPVADKKQFTPENISIPKESPQLDALPSPNIPNISFAATPKTARAIQEQLKNKLLNKVKKVVFQQTKYKKEEIMKIDDDFDAL